MINGMNDDFARSGKEVALLPPPPLRTARATFTASSSSLPKMPCSTHRHNTQIAVKACPVPCAVRLIGCPYASPVEHYRVNWTILICSRFRIASVEAHQFWAFALTAICPSSIQRFDLCSRPGRPCRSLPAFACGYLVFRLNHYPSHYKMAFAFSALLYLLRI